MKISSLSLFSEMTNSFNNYPPLVKKKQKQMMTSKYNQVFCHTNNCYNEL